MAKKTIKMGTVPINRGEYNPNTIYYKDNLVQFEGWSYICIVNKVSGVLPTDTSKFKIFASSKFENLPDESVGLNNLTQAAKDFIGSEGTITNAPDDEDLTVTEDNLLKFKDKEFNANQASGLGRVILRKNWKDGKNILTQEMIDTPNTIYILQYDFTLNNETIRLKENCILRFEGGSINNGTIYGRDTIVEGTTASSALFYGSFYNEKKEILTYKLDTIKHKILMSAGIQADSLLQRQNIYHFGLNAVSLQLLAMYCEDGSVKFHSYIDYPIYADVTFEKLAPIIRNMGYKLPILRFELRKTYSLTADGQVVKQDYSEFSDTAKRQKLIQGYKKAVMEQIKKWSSVKEEFGIEYIGVENECYRGTFDLTDYQDYYNMLKELGNSAKSYGFKSLLSNVRSSSIFGNNVPTFINPDDFDVFSINTYESLGYKTSDDIVKYDEELSKWYADSLFNVFQYYIAIKQNKGIYITEAGIMPFYSSCDAPWSGHTDGARDDSDSIIRTFHKNTMNFMKRYGDIKMYTWWFLTSTSDIFTQNHIDYVYNTVLNGEA